MHYKYLMIDSMLEKGMVLPEIRLALTIVDQLVKVKNCGHLDMLDYLEGRNMVFISLKRTDMEAAQKALSWFKTNYTKMNYHLSHIYELFIDERCEFVFGRDDELLMMDFLACRVKAEYRPTDQLQKLTQDELIARLG